MVLDVFLGFVDNVGSMEFKPERLAIGYSMPEVTVIYGLCGRFTLVTLRN